MDHRMMKRQFDGGERLISNQITNQFKNYVGQSKLNIRLQGRTKELSAGPQKGYGQRKGTLPVKFERLVRASGPSSSSLENQTSLQNQSELMNTLQNQGQFLATRELNNSTLRNNYETLTFDQIKT